MKIQTSICPDCKHFEHECGDQIDLGCMEHCLHENKEIKNVFYEQEVILKCNGFELQ